VIEVLEKVSQPFLQQEVQLALQQKGYLVYDADLTGRPVSSTSTSYPDTAFGYMGDTICLGYQVAVVSFHSPSYGRLWLVNQLHPGDTVSVTQAQALVLAAEQRTGLRPLRRVNLLKQRIRQVEACCCAAEQQAASSEERLRLAQLRVQETEHALAEAQRHCRSVEADYEREQRQLTSHCKLTRARQQLLMYQQRLPRTQQALGVAQRRSTRHTALWAAADSELTQLRQHAKRLQADNLTNAQPVRIHLRLDGGFASQENLAWVIEMGYDLYSKARSTHVRDTLLAEVTPASPWQRVGGNASLLAWTNTTVDGAFLYPLNVALAQYHTGGFTPTMLGKPLKRGLRKAKVSFKCIISKCAPLRRYACKNTLPALPPTLCALQRLGLSSSRCRPLALTPLPSNRWCRSQPTPRPMSSAKAMFGCYCSQSRVCTQALSCVWGMVPSNSPCPASVTFIFATFEPFSL
jgi:hypothetical protein